MSDLHDPWDTPEGKEVWKSKAQYFTWLRGAMRRMWADYPLRKVWKKAQMRSVTPEERSKRVFHPSTKSVGMCVFCEEWFSASKLECDHKAASEGCKDKETAELFLWHCTGLVADHFQLTCKPCHKIESYREAHGISFEEARCTKAAIFIQKEGDVLWLTERGLKPESNAKKRREQIIEYLKENK